MIDIFRGVVLGLVQGLTEFFPVSSSGHLILVPSLLGWPDQGLAFDTVLHLGTLAALLWAFRKDLHALLLRITEGDKASRQFGLRLLVAALPGLLVGALFGDLIETYLRGPVPVAFDLAFWALVLLAADRFAAKKGDALKNAQRASWRQALSVGISQAIALFPGTSRSGITMTAGLLSGMDRATAVTFSFYLSIPTIAAAGSYGILKIIREPSVLGAGGFPPLVAGFFAAIVSGVWAIRFLRSYVSTHSFNAFIWYRLALAAIVLLVVR
jgi:undecaprenyl-diphosphatase